LRRGLLLGARTRPTLAMAVVVRGAPWRARNQQRAYALREPRGLTNRSHCRRVICHDASHQASDLLAQSSRTPAGKTSDRRLAGWPSPLDRDIWKMALPSLATVLMDPLLGLVDTGTAQPSCVRASLVCADAVRYAAGIKCMSSARACHWLGRSPPRLNSDIHQIRKHASCTDTTACTIAAAAPHPAHLVSEHVLSPPLVSPPCPRPFCRSSHSQANR
jgi:hypothetical protein